MKCCISLRIFVYPGDFSTLHLCALCCLVVGSCFSSVANFAVVSMLGKALRGICDDLTEPKQSSYQGMETNVLPVVPRINGVFSIPMLEEYGNSL